MAGIIMQVNADGSVYVGETPANTAEEAQAKLDNDGDTDNGTKMIAYIPLDESDPIVRAFGALIEVCWDARTDSKKLPPIDALLLDIFEAGRKFGAETK